MLLQDPGVVPGESSWMRCSSWLAMCCTKPRASGEALLAAAALPALLVGERCTQPSLPALLTREQGLGSHNRFCEWFTAALLVARVGEGAAPSLAACRTLRLCVHMSRFTRGSGHRQIVRAFGCAPLRRQHLRSLTCSHGSCRDTSACAQSCSMLRNSARVPRAHS